MQVNEGEKQVLVEIGNGVIGIPTLTETKMKKKQETWN